MPDEQFGQTIRHTCHQFGIFSLEPNVKSFGTHHVNLYPRFDFFHGVRVRRVQLELLNYFLEEWTAEQWRGVVDINLNGMFYCIQQAFRTMKAQTPRGGRIINNGSISATAPRPNSIAYTATKHAVQGLTKTASLDGRKHDIAVGQIDVGNALTELAARMAKGVAQANGEIAIEPVMDVAIVGQSVLYMANLPLEANVLFHTVMATKMPFVGRG